VTPDPDAASPQTAATGAGASPRLHGTIHLLFALEIGQGVDLDRAEHRLVDAAQAAAPQALRSGLPRGTTRGAVGFEYTPLPLQVREAAPAIEIEGERLAERVSITLFDFGALSVAYERPFEGTLSDLRRLAPALLDRADLLADARTRATTLLGQLGDAVDRPHLADAYEDLIVHAIDPASLCEGGGPLPPLDETDLAGILRCEAGPLSAEQVRDALAERISYAPDDLLLVDWTAAVLVDREPAPTLAVLAFLNTQALELRFLDARLDRALEDAYETLRRNRTPHGLGWRWSRAAREWRRIAVLQVDAALLYESISNALKLVGDQHLARVAAATARRLHLPEWERNILRKIEVLDSIHGKFSDQQANQRIEVLEWVIIVLIAIEVVFGLIPSLIWG
jgi:hypothetical protein